MDLGTGPEIQELLVEKLQEAVLDGNPLSNIQVDPKLADIVTQQDQIGWEQLMQGQCGLAWNTHDRLQPGTTRRQNGNWTTEVITFIFEQWWKLWESRNQDQHGRYQASQLQAQELQVNHELQIFYKDYSEKGPQEMKRLFDMTIETHREQSTAATRQ